MATSPTSLQPDTTPKVNESAQPSEPDSPLVKFLETKGPGIQHICFGVDGVGAEVKAYLDKGATLIDQKPRPVLTTRKSPLFTPNPRSGVLIELRELPVRCLVTKNKG